MVAARPCAEILDALRSPYAADDLLPDSRPPVLVVDITGTAVQSADAEALKALPAVTVAVADDPDTCGTGVEAFDVVLSAGADPRNRPSNQSEPWVSPVGGVDLALESIVARTHSNPQASVGLSRLLRMSSRLEVPDGLVAESLMYSTLQSGPEHRRWVTSRATPSVVETDPIPVLVERSGSELRICFNRPEIHNAFGFEARDALVEALQLAWFDTTIDTVQISGRGPSFCSGGDLREFGTLPDPSTAHTIRTTRSAGYWMHRLSERVRLHVHGACIGAGIELPAFAGMIVATPDTVITLPEVGMGLVPGAGGTVSLPRRIGRHRTAYLALTGVELPVTTALEWGLVDEITDR